MPIFTQSNMSIAGNVVDIRAVVESPGLVFMQPGTFVEIPESAFAVRKGIITVTVDSLDKNQPTSHEHGQTIRNCLPLTIDVFKTGSPSPVASATTTAERIPAPTPDHPRRDHRTHLQVDAGPVDETAPYSRTEWRVRLTNATDRVAQVGWKIQYIRDSSLITEAKIPITLLNNTFGIVLNALAPKASLRGRELTLQISPEIAEFSGSLPTDGLFVRELEELPVDAHGDLISVGVGLVSGADALREVDEEFAAREAAIDENAVPSIVEEQRRANKRWRDGWHEKIDATDVAVRLKVVFTDIDLILGHLWTQTISAGQIADVAARILLVFKSHTAFLPEQFGKAHALVITPAHYEGVLATIADVLGLVPGIGAKIEEYVNEAIPKIHLYFAETMIRMVHDQYQKRFIDCRTTGDDLFVRFCDDPADPDAFPRAAPPRPTPPATDGNRSRPRVFSGLRSAANLAPITGSRRPVLEPSVVAPEPAGVVPEGFDLGSAESIERLDNIETIVVTMMENRSFDHLLGRLSRKWPNKGYLCYPDDATNVVPGRSPLKMVPARDVQLRNTYYAITVDPYHGTDHVLRQINGGLMDGFARDILTKPEERDRDPQIPLTYYDEADLPFFYYLAERYLVCDQWFAAHPGGTYPNRWAFLSGTMPFTKNFPPDDRRMGFIKTATIFDHLSNASVDWVYYESNIGMLRMYDRYRLDDTRVLPYDHPTLGFEARAKAGTLPPVVFIEPKITGIPPLEQASDDHPPANLLRGQDFFNGEHGVYTALKKSPQWARSMLVITYDEHGGFYDHVPPPGTPHGDPAWRERGFPKIHPEGQTFLGPRVPTFVVSPFVEPGSVSHQIFDHTSVLKTILVRHRARFSRNTFNLFGERVPIIAHLGNVLSRPAPLLEPSAAPARKARTRQNYGDVRRPPVTMASIPAEAQADHDELSYGFSLARAMLPKR